MASRRIRPQGSTNIVFEYMLDNETWHDRVRTLKAEAKEDEATEEGRIEYLSRWLREVPQISDENTFELRLARWALSTVDWEELAKWILRDDTWYPQPEGWFPGKGLEDNPEIGRDMRKHPDPKLPD